MLPEVFMGLYEVVKMHMLLHKETALTCCPCFEMCVSFLCWPTFETGHLYADLEQRWFKSLAFVFYPWCLVLVCRSHRKLISCSRLALYTLRH